MSDKTPTPEAIEVTIDRKRRMRFTFAALLRVNEQYPEIDDPRLLRGDLWRPVFDDNGEATRATMGKLKSLRILFWACLLDEDPDITPAGADALLDRYAQENGGLFSPALVNLAMQVWGAMDVGGIGTAGHEGAGKNGEAGATDLH